MANKSNIAAIVISIVSLCTAGVSIGVAVNSKNSAKSAPAETQTTTAAVTEAPVTTTTTTTAAPAPVSAEETKPADDSTAQYVMYVGTNDKDTYKPEHTKDEALQIVDKICLKYFEGYTLQEATGSWKDEKDNITHEYTIVCYFDGADKDTVHKAADEIIAALNQNTVLIEESSIGMEYYSNPNAAASTAETADTDKTTAEPVLTLWTDSAPAKEKLTEYIDSITVEGSEDYIPPEDRIAVFDFDGTLFCETDPNYFDYTLLKYRVLEDPDYKDKASKFEKETAKKIKKQNETGESFKGLETDHGKAVASAFAGMTMDEFNDYIQEFKNQDMPSYEGMKRGEGFYKPMLEVVDYLQDNDFTVYIISGTDRFIVRGIFCDSELNLPNKQIIGSDESVVASEQGDADGLDYFYTDHDKLVLGGDFLIKNLKMNKVTVINQEIGQQPVLSFGNSSGDASMAEYVTSGNKYKSLAFMLCCDDTERENGNEEKAQKMYDMCEEFDWIPVSMKNDWTTIYGDGVTYIKK